MFLILHLWRTDKRDVAVVWRIKTDLLRLLPSPPWRNITIRLSVLFLAPPVTLAPSISAKSFHMQE